jgi:hypothetical protein
MGSPNECYWPVRNLIVKSNDEHWQDIPKTIPDLVADSKDGLYDLIREYATCTDASNKEIEASLKHCGYSVIPSNPNKWYLSS